MQYLVALAALAMTAPTRALVTSVAAGEMTWTLEAGTGACGTTASDAGLFLALPVAMYGDDANPNNAAVCGQTVAITYNGKTVNAVVWDKCPTCAANHIDVSEAVFETFAATSVGVLTDVSWELA